jgi:hypothetical protein
MSTIQENLVEAMKRLEELSDLLAIIQGQATGIPGTPSVPTKLATIIRTPHANSFIVSGKNGAGYPLFENYTSIQHLKGTKVLIEAKQVIADGRAIYYKKVALAPDKTVLYLRGIDISVP